MSVDPQNWLCLNLIRPRHRDDYALKAPPSEQKHHPTVREIPTRTKLLDGWEKEDARPCASSVKKRGRAILPLHPGGYAGGKCASSALILRTGNRTRNTARRFASRRLAGWLDRWEQEADAYGGKYCGYSPIEGVKTALRMYRTSLPPACRTFDCSFRHKVATVLRQVSMMLGHRRANLRNAGGPSVLG